MILLNDNSVYSASAMGIYKTTNDGINWTISLGNVYGYSLDTSSNKEIYCSTFDGVYKTSDNGISWVRLENLKWTQIKSVDIAVNGYIFAAVWNGPILRSTDNGISFVNIAHPHMIYKANCAVTTNDGYLYCGTFYQGIWRSSDYGETWLKQYPGERTTYLINKLCEGHNGNVFASTIYGLNGVVRSTDHGERWLGYSFRDGTKNSSFLTTANNGRIFSGTREGEAGQITNDDAETWIDPDFDFVPLSIAKNETNGFLFAIDQSSNASKFSWVYKSTDNGDSWTIIDLTDLCWWITGNYVSKNGNNFIQASSALFKSTNNGANWVNISTDNYYNIVEDNHNFIFGKKTGGLFRTTNEGQNWELVLPLSNINGAAYLTDSNYLYVAGDNTLFKSVDNGNNWVKENISGKVTSIVENNSGRIFIGVYGTGVFMKTDTGWVDMTYDLENKNVNTLCFNTLGQLLAGTTTGVFRSNDAVISINNQNSEIPKQFLLQQNYPNPFNPTTTISYQLPKSGLIQITIYDLAGKKIIDLVNEYKHAGSYEAEFEGSNLPSGVYFYKLTAGDFEETRRMVLVK